MMGGMATTPALEREEYVEQAYFFRVLRERMAGQMAAQDILGRLHEEMLSTPRLPYAIQFLSAELKHTGLLSSGFSRLPHYFTRSRRSSSVAPSRRGCASTWRRRCWCWSA